MTEKKYEGYFKIGIIKELTKQGVLKEDEEEKLVKQIARKYKIEV